MFAAGIVPYFHFKALQLCPETHVMALCLGAVTSLCSIVSLHAGFTCNKLVPEPASFAWGQVFPQEMEDGVWWPWPLMGTTLHSIRTMQ